MNVRIESHYKGHIPINFEKMIHSLLIKVPGEDLVGLSAIAIQNRVTHNHSQKASGLYWQKSGHKQARIEIAIDTIYNSMPRVIFYLPFIPRFMLANVLYHEIGHHCQSSNLKKEAWEVSATNYKKKMLNKTFYLWKALFLPFAPLVQLLNKKNDK